MLSVSLLLMAFGMWLLTQPELQVTATRKLGRPAATWVGAFYTLIGVVLVALSAPIPTPGSLDDPANARLFWLLSWWIGVLGLCAVGTISIVVWTYRAQKQAAPDAG
ncbi:MAG: hypothetical protein ACYC63_21430 [Armatimonadota bacterium]